MPTFEDPHPTRSTRTGDLRCAAGMAIVGASFVASAALADFPVLGGQAVRYAVAALVLLAVLAWRRVPWVLPSPHALLRLAALAATGLVGFSVLVVEGTGRADPSLVGAVVGAAPVVLAVTTALRTRRVAARTVVAAVVVTGGVVLVEGGGSGDPVGVAIAVGALVCEVCFSLLAVPLLPTLGVLRVSAYACVLAVPQLAILGLLAPGPFLAVPDPAELAALAYLAVVVTAVAFLLWYSGLAAVGPARAGLFAGLLPVSALVVSVALGSEELAATSALGTLVVGCGLALGLRAPTRRSAGRRGTATVAVVSSTEPTPSTPVDPTAALPRQVSETFDPSAWRDVVGFEELTDVTYHRGVERDAVGAVLRDLPVVRIAFDRPEVRNAFRPHTVDELYRVLDHARMTSDVGTVLLTGNGPSPKDDVWAFCSGGDQRIRGRSGYQYTTAPDGGGDVHTRDAVDPGRAGRLHILEVQRLVRTMPKVVVAVVNGWAAGGGHSLHVVADLSIASREHARFKQTDADVGSFDGGYGSAYLARQVGQKRAREIFFLAREYSAQDAYEWGAVNEVADHADLEALALEYARTIATKSPQAIRMLKFAFNLADDGLMGQQVFAGEATRLAYMTDEAVEGRDAFLERRDPDWGRFGYAY